MDNNEPSRRALRLYVIVAVVAAAVTAGIAALLVNIFQRKQEARSTYVKLVEVTEDDVDPAKWGTNWPREYDGYLRTAEPTATKYGGALVGPEGTLPPQKAQRDPWVTRIFAGYLFAVDYRDRRGHAYMLNDQEVTKRNVPTEAKQSGASAGRVDRPGAAGAGAGGVAGGRQAAAALAGRARAGAARRRGEADALSFSEIR